MGKAAKEASKRERERGAAHMKWVVVVLGGEEELSRKRKT